jgi:hypothetical protein
MSNAVNKTVASPITIGTRVRVEAGCKAREVAKNCSAVVVAVTEMGADYGHCVRVTLEMRNGFKAGQRVSFYARHINRLTDHVISLNDGNPSHKIQISRA